MKRRLLISLSTLFSEYPSLFATSLPFTFKRSTIRPARIVEQDNQDSDSVR